MSRPAASIFLFYFIFLFSKQDDDIISKETSQASMYGMYWLKERTLQPASHLDSHCHRNIPNMSKNKTIHGGFNKRIKDLNVSVPHKSAYHNS
jgi:hypothetical protein